MSRTRMQQINDELQRRGWDMVLRRDPHGYFYFTGENASLRDASVYVYAVGHLSLERWLDEADEKFSTDGYEPELEKVRLAEAAKRYFPQASILDPCPRCGGTYGLVNHSRTECDKVRRGRKQRPADVRASSR